MGSMSEDPWISCLLNQEISRTTARSNQFSETADVPSIYPFHSTYKPTPRSYGGIYSISQYKLIKLTILQLFSPTSGSLFLVSVVPISSCSSSFCFPSPASCRTLSSIIANPSNACPYFWNIPFLYPSATFL